MDKMWPSFLKDGDGDTQREAVVLFIKSVPGEKQTTCHLFVNPAGMEGVSFMTANI